MSIPLSRYLKDFGEVAATSPAFAVDALETDASVGLSDLPEEPPVDVEAERRQAYAEGHDAASRDLLEAHEREVEALAAVHRSEIEALRHKYESETAELLATKFREIAAEVARTVSDGAAAAIAPVLTEAVTQAAATNLARLLEAAILEGSAGPFTLRGPVTLFESLKAEFGGDSALLRHVEADDLDLSVNVGDAALVTRMSAWAASLRKVLE